MKSQCVTFFLKFCYSWGCVKIRRYVFHAIAGFVQNNMCKYTIITVYYLIEVNYLANYVNNIHYNTCDGD